MVVGGDRITHRSKLCRMFSGMSGLSLSPVSVTLRALIRWERPFRSIFWMA